MLIATATLLSLVIGPGAAVCADPTSSGPKIKALVITGANNHDWQWTSRELEKMLEASGRFEVDVTANPSVTLKDAAALAEYRVFVLDYNGPRWGEAAEHNFVAAVRGGVGVSVIHAANNSFPGWLEYEQMVALCWRKGTGHGKFHEFDVAIVDSDHPITAQMSNLAGHPDELYHKLVPMHGTDYRVLATARSSKESGGTGDDEPMIIVTSYGKGRVFHTPLGHVWPDVPETRVSLADPQLRQLVCRGTEWAATGEVTLPAAPPNYLTAAEKAAGFRLLFDGETTAGWRGYRQKGFPEQGWRVESGCLERVAGGGGDIITVEEFADFELRFEWAVAKGANSGVVFRCDEAEDACWLTGPEFQILDDGEPAGAGRHSAGALYDLCAPVGKVVRPVGEFNQARLVVRGRHVEHWLNGVKVVDVEMEGDEWQKCLDASKFQAMPRFATLPEGHIALQDHGDTVRYRGLRIREF